ncbi:hypothetical protein OFA97_06155 [Lactiplantibacillus plantarum]|nr:hypothetical protein OFA97_06155 [Lactiplantibacillus plantarum]
MTYFDPDEILQTKEEALDYMEVHGIMTDATFPNRSGRCIGNNVQVRILPGA